MTCPKCHGEGVVLVWRFVYPWGPDWEAAGRPAEGEWQEDGQEQCDKCLGAGETGFNAVPEGCV